MSQSISRTGIVHYYYYLIDFRRIPASNAGLELTSIDTSRPVEHSCNQVQAITQFDPHLSLKWHSIAIVGCVKPPT